MANYQPYNRLRGHGEELEYERHPSGISFHWEGHSQEEPDEDLGVPDTPSSNTTAFHAASVPDPDFPRFHAYEGKGEISRHYQCLPLVEVSSTVDVQSTVAKTTLTQEYRNPANRPIREANYSFPLYDGVAIVSFRCCIGPDKFLEGQITPKAKAEAAFDRAVAEQQQSAALLNEHTPEIFEVRLGNIPPRTTIKVDIVYVHELKPDLGGQGVLLTIPTSIASRYGQALSCYSESSTSLQRRGLKITVNVTASVPIRTLESSSHPISVEMGTCGSSSTAALLADLASGSDATDHDPRRARATMSDRNVALGKDFVLLIMAAGSTFLQSQALLEPTLSATGEAAMMISLNPREILASQTLSGDFQGEIIFLADRSGSMLGSKISTLRDALQLFLKSLPVKCHFNIGSFGTSFPPLWPSSVAYTQKSLEKAIEHLAPGSFDANMGGTEILPALQELVKPSSSGGFESTQIIVLTDGEVWNTENTIRFVRESTVQGRGKIRFFALGIGDAVSHRLIEGIGREGGGFGEVVVLDSQGRWDERVIRMLKGALMPSSWTCDVSFPEWPFPHSSVAASDIPSDPSPYIRAPFTNQTLHPFARHSVFFLLGHETDPLPENVTVKATHPNGYSITYNLSITRMSSRTSAIHFLAAKSAMLDLENSTSWLHSSTAFVDDALNGQIKKEAERLGTLYGITGKWTSFVAVDQKNKVENSVRSYKAKPVDLAFLSRDRYPPLSSQRRRLAAQLTSLEAETLIPFHGQIAREILAIQGPIGSACYSRAGQIERRERSIVPSAPAKHGQTVCEDDSDSDGGPAGRTPRRRKESGVLFHLYPQLELIDWGNAVDNKGKTALNRDTTVPDVESDSSGFSIPKGEFKCSSVDRSLNFDSSFSEIQYYQPYHGRGGVSRDLSEPPIYQSNLGNQLEKYPMPPSPDKFTNNTPEEPRSELGLHRSPKFADTDDRGRSVKSQAALTAELTGVDVAAREVSNDNYDNGFEYDPRNSLKHQYKNPQRPIYQTVSFQLLVTKQKADGSFLLDRTTWAAVRSNFGGFCVTSLLAILCRPNEPNQVPRTKLRFRLSKHAAPFGQLFYCPVAACRFSFGYYRLFKEHIAAKHPDHSPVTSSSDLGLTPQFQEQKHTIGWPEGAQAAPEPRKGWNVFPGKPKYEGGIADTFLAAWYIRKVYPQEKDSWDLMLRKAKSWLNNETGVPDYHLREMDDVLEEFWRSNYAEWKLSWDMVDTDEEDPSDDDDAVVTKSHESLKNEGRSSGKWQKVWIQHFLKAIRR